MLSENIRALFAGKVYDADPIRIISSPENQYDEYDKEIEEVCKAVEVTDSVPVIQEKIGEVFHRWFCYCLDESGKFVAVHCCCGGKKKYGDLAIELRKIIVENG